MSTQKRTTDSDIVGSFKRPSGVVVQIPKGSAGDIARDHASQLHGLLATMASSDISVDLRRSLELAIVIASDLYEMIDIVEDDSMVGVVSPVVSAAPPKLVMAS